MRRLEFTGLFSGAAAAQPLAARGEQSQRVPVVGVLCIAVMRVSMCAVAMLLAFGSFNSLRAESAVDALRGHRLRAEHSDCYFDKPTKKITMLYINNDMLVEESPPAPGYSAWRYTYPLNGSSSAVISGDSIISKGFATATFRISADGSTCSYQLACPERRRSQVYSCTMEAMGDRQQTAAPQSNSTNKVLVSPIKVQKDKPSGSSKTEQTSASCSDITGTNSTAPAADDCKDANTFLHSARVIRKDYGLLAQEQYKQAAKSYRLAGDTAKADAALREAALSDQAFDAEQNAAAMNQPNPVREALLRSADTMLKSARDIDSRPATCSEFRDAAAFYFQAGRFLFDAGETQKADRIFLRRDFLNNEVDRMEQEGRCHAHETHTPAFASSEKCKPVVEAVKYLRRIGGDLASLNSLSTPSCNIAEIKRAVFHECIRIYMDDEMDASERVRQANEFGCPLAKR
jgi:hypothetical protein